MSKQLKHIKSSGFKTPEAYFDGIEDAVFSKLKSEHMSQIPDTTGFSVPSDYFETVEAKVFESLQSHDTKVVSLFTKRNLIYLGGVAAAIILMLSIFNTESSMTDQDFDYAMVEEYIINQDLSSDDIASIFSTDDLIEDNFDIITDEMADDTLETYLIENTNLNDLIED